MTKQSKILLNNLDKSQLKLIYARNSVICMLSIKELPPAFKSKLEKVSILLRDAMLDNSNVLYKLERV